MIWFKLLSRFIKVLHSQASPTQIALGLAMGAVVGLSPTLAPQSLLVFLVILLVNVNLAAAFLSIALFKIVGLALAGPAHAIGGYLLIDAASLGGLWTTLYNTPVVPFTRFNNTVVLGKMVVALVAFVPVVVFSRIGVVSYRAHVMGRTQQYRILKALTATKLYKWYRRLADFTE